MLLIKTRISLFFILMTAIGAAQAMPYDIADGYIGARGTTPYSGDVIGSTSDFQIFGIDLELNGSLLKVDIFTNFAGKADEGLFGWGPGTDLTYGTGIGYGDLFLSSGWNPYGSAPYTADYSGNGTLWEYGFALDNRFADTGSGSLYQLTGASNSDNALMTDDFISGGFYRNGQEVAVRDAMKTTQNLVSTGVFTSDSDRVTMVFDIGGTSMMDTGEIALHWAMTCGNDTIEGSYDVAEPATLSLLGLSLLGLGFLRRRTGQS